MLNCGRCGAVLTEILEVEGLVYVLSNPVMPGLLKIGYTTRLIDERLEELASATGVPASFQLEALFDVDQPQSIERSVHIELAAYRLAENREFFRCGVETAVAAIERYAGSVAILRSVGPMRDPLTASRVDRPTGRTRHVIATRRREFRCGCGHTSSVSLAGWETHWRCQSCQTLRPI